VNGLIELAQAVRDEENRQKEQFIADMKVSMPSSTIRNGGTHCIMWLCISHLTIRRRIYDSSYPTVPPTRACTLLTQLTGNALKRAQKKEREAQHQKRFYIRSLQYNNEVILMTKMREMDLLW
jgi:hypothetical protein